MNKKEISELRRRFSPDKNSIGHIYGCYVNTKKEIIAYLDESLAAMPPEEAEKYLGLLKKALSGTQGTRYLRVHCVLYAAGGGQPRAQAAHVAAGERAQGPGGATGVLRQGHRVAGHG